MAGVSSSELPLKQSLRCCALPMLALKVNRRSCYEHNSKKHCMTFVSCSAFLGGDTKKMGMIDKTKTCVLYVIERIISGISIRRTRRSLF